MMHWLNVISTCLLFVPVASLFVIPMVGNVIRVYKVAQANTEGKYITGWMYYSIIEPMGKKHLALQSDMYEHSAGEPFYGNTFTGWRKFVYNISYTHILRQQQRQRKTVQRAEARQRQTEQKLRGKLTMADVKSQLLSNRKEYVAKQTVEPKGVAS